MLMGMATASDFRPATHDLVLVRGDTVELHFRFGVGEQTLGVWTLTEGADLSGVEFAAQIWDKSNTTKLADLTVDLDDQSDPETQGGFFVRGDAAVMADVPVGKHKWDLQATWPGGRVKTYLAGSATIKADYTRPVPP